MAAKGSEITWVRLRSKTTGDWFVHPDLRARMIEDANERGTNQTDLAVQILCQHFQVSYTPNQRKSSPSSDATVLNFGMPPELERVISATYPKHRMDGIRYVLCVHYGLPVPAKVKQTRRRQPRAAAA